MPTHPLKIAGFVAAATVGPYVATETDTGRSAVSQVRVMLTDATSTTAEPDGNALGAANDYATHSHYQVETLREVSDSRYRYDEDLARKLGAIPADPASSPSLSGFRVQDLRAVMRFDINPAWVIANFSRVSTVLADMSLKGLRVPIVTGTRADDLAGTLTYYFDNADKLQRLTIHGFTGDAQRFERAMTTHYGLEREASLEAGAYTKRWNGRPTHFMRLTHAPVVYSDAVHHKYTVFLELNQPNLAYGISAEAQKIVDSDHHTGRW
ncbi:hypothetical protein NHH03_06500 [Stieleria sp. TO1_6]|uniref:DUF6690 family protein n=1 Tax=Stieleria tagensis TaxID=2956795 RepID=UPI00209B8E7B|nr:DUF6690 family protein [Stieleria tagensis]MCO8121381.1 hypothetical protein [Stieleria tagensis]